MSGPNGNGAEAGMIHKTAWEAAMPAVQVRFRCEVVSTTREGVIDQLSEILGREGYLVSKKVAWEKIGAFRKRMNLAHDALHRILASRNCPPVELERGNARKQLLAINSNPIFEAFVVALRGKKPARPPYKRKSRAKPAHLLQRARQRRYQTAPTT